VVGGVVVGGVVVVVGLEVVVGRSVVLVVASDVVEPLVSASSGAVAPATAVPTTSRPPAMTTPTRVAVDQLFQSYQRVGPGAGGRAGYRPRSSGGGGGG
jgi:hypothetical protein